MHNSVLLFLNIGGPEMILIIFVALLLFGGEKLPEIARGLGKGIRDFKDASEGVKREITNQIYNYEEKKTETADAENKTSDPSRQLPAAEGSESEQKEETASQEPNTVPHTMPYIEGHAAEHTETAEPVSETKEEPVKTTHE
ncbi:MAG TPA: twin-arginine translocase TatA/TatE family subunit [Mucilaginibacter sp.]|nr:twin-arginine translocase TatA/TatE family subunit [Mucilaginibacter sp.]